MSYETAAQAIRSHMATWLTTPIAWPNREPSFEMDASKAWVRPSILPASALRTIGEAPVSRRLGGLVAIQVFVPIGEGQSEIWEVVDGLVTLFRDPAITGITFAEPEPRRVGIDNEGWEQWTVDVRFWRWETN